MLRRERRGASAALGVLGVTSPVRGQRSTEGEPKEADGKVRIRPAP